MSSPEVTIAMPVYNERSRIESAVARVLETDLRADYELVIVDDGSTDGTSAVLAAASWPEHVRVVEHERNRGKGVAVRTALATARGTYTVVMDADLEYDPADIPLLLDPLRRGEASAVFGSRGFQSHSAYSFWYVVGNRFVTLVANLLFNSWISDIMTGQKAIDTALFRSLPLRARGFAIEAEITARLLRAGVRIYEVPVVYRARRRDEGKKLTSFDGVRVLATLLRCRVF